MKLSTDPLISVSSAQQRLLNRFSPLPAEKAPLAGARGRVLAEVILSPTDLPPFPNSSMDGFAVKIEDVEKAAPDTPVSLNVVGDIPAGEAPSLVLQAGQAARIMTGAPVPGGADAVVPVEDTDFNVRQPGTRAPETVMIYRPASRGDNIRPQGQDVRKREVVLNPGSRLRAQDLGFLSMLGVADVPVHRLPRIAIFSTGDELIPVEEPLAPGKIHDANSYILIGLVEQAGGTAVNLGIVPDREVDVRERLDQAVSEEVDLILSSAGVSVGAFDFVKSVVEEQGELDFWRVNMRPGKPLAFGHYQGIPFIGLPGNPVSAYVGYEVFVRPAISRLSGEARFERPRMRAVLAEAIESDGRESYLRAVVKRLDGQITASLTGHQGSGNLRSLVQANALVVIPAGEKSLPAGAEVEAWPLGAVEFHEIL